MVDEHKQAAFYQAVKKMASLLMNSSHYVEPKVARFLATEYFLEADTPVDEFNQLESCDKFSRAFAYSMEMVELFDKYKAQLPKYELMVI